mgnify:CR=1 FL=1
MNVITATKSNNTITVFVNDNGVVKPIPATSEHPKWAELVKAWNEQNHEAMLELLSMKRIVEKFSSGDLIVSDQGVFYRDVPLAGIDVDRIMAFLRQGEPYQPIANYMVRKLKNPSKRAISEMYNFLEHKNMPLTPNGTILAYKGVRKDFFSVSSGNEPLISGRRNEAGQIFNGIGEVIEMNRSSVDDDFRRGCSGGLHAGSLEYAKDWARQHNGIIILIEIDPADVVSVPEDCNCKKLRCCKYKVIGTYDGPLPDTYTTDYSMSEYPSCEDTCEEDDTEEICDDCGEYVSDCSCDDEKEEYDDCNASCKKCYLKADSKMSPEDYNKAGLNEKYKVENANSLTEVFHNKQIETAAEKITQNLVGSNNYEQGYQLGFRNGVRRRKRLFYQKDTEAGGECILAQWDDRRKRLFYQKDTASSEFERGYCDGYRAGRKDYKH